MQPPRSLKNQQGYALTEVLIAGVIAASALTVTASGISTGVRAARDVSHMETYIFEATQISNQLRAGLTIENVAQNFPSWQSVLSIRSQDGNNRSNSSHLAMYQFSRKESTDRPFEFSVSRLEKGDQ